MSSPTSPNAIRIEILPESGYTFNGEPVFGPGSIVEGHVKMSLLQSLPGRRLRLVFHAVESIQRQLKENTQIHPQRQQFFGSQRTLWEGDHVLTAKCYHFPFAIQLPQVQFPPSMTHDVFPYSCTFKLSLYLDKSETNAVLDDAELLHQCTLLYRPTIETSHIKLPFVKHETISLNNTITTQINSLGYLAGETICGRFKSTHPTFLSLYFYRVTTTSQQPQVFQTTLLVQSKDTYVHSDETAILLTLPDNLVPSFTYGRILNMWYTLRIYAASASSTATSCSFRKSLRKKPVQKMILEMPITIGTLARGYRASSELQVYSVFRNVFDKQGSGALLPVPKFIEIVEYEDTLPQYSATQLPSYDSLQDTIS